MPVLVTTTKARPYTTNEPENTKFFRSPGPPYPLNDRLGLLHPSLSPVRELSFTFRGVVVGGIRPSATTISPPPAPRYPRGQSGRRGMINRSPSRNTRAVGADIAFKLSRDFSAFTVLYRSQHRVKDEHGKDDDGALRVAREHRDHRSHNEG